MALVGCGIFGGYVSGVVVIRFCLRILAIRDVYGIVVIRFVRGTIFCKVEIAVVDEVDYTCLVDVELYCTL